MEEIFKIINGMSPYLLLGFLLAGIMHAFVPAKFYSKYLSRRSFRSVLNSALLGIPLPLCSCGVIPTAMSLRKEGATKGAVVSFLIATPQTGVDSIMATYSLMGLPFAIMRPIVALVTAVFGGFLIDKTDNQTSSQKSSCHCHTDNHELNSCHCHEGHNHEEGSCHCHGGHNHEEGSCHCHEGHNHEEGSCHCHEGHNHIDEASSNKKGFLVKIKEAFSYAYVDMMEDIGKWLLVGLIVAGLLTAFVPEEYFRIFQGNTLASMLLVLCIAIPMYLCATGSIPIAVALMIKGLTPGAALVMLMAGPACNFASILVLQRSLGTRTMLGYIFSITIGAVLFGCLVDWLQFSGYVDFLYLLKESTCSTEQGAGWFQWICSAILGLLLINALVLPKLGLREKKCCHCHTH